MNRLSREFPTWLTCDCMFWRTESPCVMVLFAPAGALLLEV